MGWYTIQEEHISKSCIEKMRDVVYQFIDNEMIVNERNYDKHSLIETVHGNDKMFNKEISMVINHGYDGIRVMVYFDNQHHMDLRLDHIYDLYEYDLIGEVKDESDEWLLINLVGSITSVICSEENKSTDSSRREYTMIPCYPQTGGCDGEEITEGINEMVGQTFNDKHLNDVHFKQNIHFINCKFVNCKFTCVFFQGMCVNCKFINCTFDNVDIEFDDEWMPWRVKNNIFDSCNFTTCIFMQYPFFQVTKNEIIGDYTITNSYIRNENPTPYIDDGSMSLEDEMNLYISMIDIEESDNIVDDDDIYDDGVDITQEDIEDFLRQYGDL